VEAIRALMVARRSAAGERTRAINQARALILTGPDDLRARFARQSPAALVTGIARLRPRPGDVAGHAVRIALRELGRRAQFLDGQLACLDERIVPLGWAADLAQDAGRLAGWVNNAAVFRDAWIDAVPAREITGLIMASLSLAVTGCATAIRRFLAAGAGGSAGGVSSQQAQRAVRGALPYATAKAAVQGLTRALAVGYLLSADAAFVNGAVLPVDGGRSVLGHDPQQA
jgi:NAD(P)-dependent dehydrogenase (short-subunit alcohol dehydrogenase family)